MSKILLTLDPAKSTGYSIAKIEEKICSIIEYGFIDVDTSSPYMGDWCINLQQKLDEINERIKIDEVAVEDYFYSSRFKQGSNVNPAYRTAIHMWSRNLNLHYEILNISSWKIYVCGRTTPTKQQKQKWGASNAKKMMVVQALWERHGIKFPNHSTSHKTGKPIQFRFDIADAVAQSMYAAYLRFNCNNFISLVDVPEDVLFKNVNKKHFVYD
jgi:Holliday junction resolvasome RuvABC endonuclease subunit